jgi:hypothetical protein
VTPEVAALRSRLDEALDRPIAEPEDFEAIAALALETFAAEERLFDARLAARFPTLTAKMRAQHDYARELIEAARGAVSANEFIRLAGHFRALAQHNLIEEDRDLLRLAAL